MRQLLAQGLLAVEGDYGTLTLTEASAAVLRSQHQVLLRREPELAARPARARRTVTAAGGTAASELPAEAAGRFEQLRAWRAATAKEQGVPAYVIFHDATLREIAATQPSSLAALGKVSGVGETKLAKYGDQVLNVLVPGATGMPG